MVEVTAEQFAEFFEELWGHRPFAWQQALADRVTKLPEISGTDEGSWPEAIALPTASGKTACIDIATFALAMQARHLHEGQLITAPRRIFFVVDRRVIVDATYDRAQLLAQRLEQAQSGILKHVADGLRQIACGDTIGYEQERPLAAYVLRGGMYRSDAWMRNPLQPLIIASTVDQIGSHLLFRAYGRSSRKWPIYAGLIAHDSLIILDEAHCARPFLQTLQSVRKYQSWGETPLGHAFHPVVMSATPPPGMNPFKDVSEEHQNPDHPLGRRQLAHKPAVLRPVKASRGRQTAVLAKALVDAALELINEQRRAIVVFVNRVATAREAYSLAAGKNDVDVILLTGRMRSVDKDAVVQRLRPLQASQSEMRSLQRPLIAVATQTLEVGADLDFDGLVTECASLDALQQRFGRLNRMGRQIEAQAVILMPIVGNPKAATRKPQDDPIYGKALNATWTWLNKQKDESGNVDFGITYLNVPKGHAITELNAPSDEATVMLPAHIDCWSQTAPVPSPSPDVSLFLHGPREGVADVQVCYRADLDLGSKDEEVAPELKDIALEQLSLCPPGSNEMLPVPLPVFRRWMGGDTTSDDSADLEGVAVVESDYGEGSPVIRWRGSATNRDDVTSDPARIRPGDIIVIPANHSYADHPLGDLPRNGEEDSTIRDIGDQAYRLSRAKPILRLHPALVKAWPDSLPVKVKVMTMLKDLVTRYADDPDDVASTLYDLLKQLVHPSESLPDAWSWLPQIANELCQEYAKTRFRRSCHVIAGKSLILIGRFPIPELIQGADGISDEDDISTSGISHRNGHPVRLQEHLCGVEKIARRYATGCGLTGEVIESIARAGLLHDLGKADPRFQALLRGGIHWFGGELLAKAAELPKTREAYNRARSSTGYPKGGRHELLSVRLAESAPGLLEGDPDLILHLLASHHGYCRPFAPVVIDEAEADTEYTLLDHKVCWHGPTRLERLDSGVSDRYWQLVRRYGWWGLAWLEGLLRLADWRRSEIEENNDGG